MKSQTIINCPCGESHTWWHDCLISIPIHYSVTSEPIKRTKRGFGLTWKEEG